jgi:hypothetical protein
MPSLLLIGLVLCGLAIIAMGTSTILSMVNFKRRNLEDTFDQHIKLMIVGVVSGFVAMAGLGCILVHFILKWA